MSPSDRSCHDAHTAPLNLSLNINSKLYLNRLQLLSLLITTDWRLGCKNELTWFASLHIWHVGSWVWQFKGENYQMLDSLVLGAICFREKMKKLLQPHSVCFRQGCLIRHLDHTILYISHNCLMVCISEGQCQEETRFSFPSQTSFSSLKKTDKKWAEYIN